MFTCMCWMLTLPMTEQAYFTSSKALRRSASLVGWWWSMTQTTSIRGFEAALPRLSICPTQWRFFQRHCYATDVSLERSINNKSCFDPVSRLRRKFSVWIAINNRWGGGSIAQWVTYLLLNPAAPSLNCNFGAFFRKNVWCCCVNWQHTAYTVENE